MSASAVTTPRTHGMQIMPWLPPGTPGRQESGVSGKISRKGREFFHWNRHTVPVPLAFASIIMCPTSS